MYVRTLFIIREAVIFIFQLSIASVRAETRTRTGDLFITNELLYQLSHFGFLLRLTSNYQLSIKHNTKKNAF